MSDSHESLTKPAPREFTEEVDARADARAPRQVPAASGALFGKGWPVICLVVVGGLVLADTARVLQCFGFRFTDDDISIFWYAAEEFLRGHFREPFFYGQEYHTLAESIPSVPLIGMGLSPAVALAVVSTAVGLLPWALLALLAWRRGPRNLAPLIAAGPLLLPVSYTMLLDKQFGSGVLAVTLAVVLIETPGRAWRALAFGLLLSIGVGVLCPNAAVVAVPALAYVALSRRARWKTYALIAVGIACGIALDVAGLDFYWRNPGWVVHPTPSYDWSVRNVRSGLRHLNDFMGWLAPWFIPVPAVDLVAIGAVAAIAARREKWPVAAAAVVAGVALVGALGFGKVHDGQTSVFFPYQRMFLGLPILIGLLLVIALRGSRRVSPRWALVAVAAAIVGLGYRQMTLNHAVVEAASRMRGVVTKPRTVTSLDAECDRIAGFAKTQGAELVVHLEDRGAAYGCGAIEYGRVVTLFPTYERRTWRLEEEQSAQRTVVVFSEASAEFCSSARERGFACALIDGRPRLAVVRTPPMSPITLLGDIGIAVRRFS
jgi:hypothetical protein